MEELKELVEDMWEELEGAEHYAGKAAHMKGVDTTRMNTYSDMARQELAHFDNLHKQGVKYMQEHAGHAEMKFVWDWETGKLMRRAFKIRSMLDMVKA